jgi:hypothetical protein
VKRDKLHDLQYEFNVLNNIQKNHSRAITEYTNKNDTRSELKLLHDKLRIIKEEYRYSRDLLKNTENKLKTQNAILINIEQKCEKIKQNIEYRKNLNEELKNENEEHVNIYSEKLKLGEMVISNQEKNYKSELIKQKGIINNLNDELSLLTVQLKEKEQEIRINELKIKELGKMKNYHSEIKSLAIKSRTKEKDRMVYLERENKERAISANMKPSVHAQLKPVKTPNIHIKSNHKPFSLNDVKFDKKKMKNHTEIIGHHHNNKSEYNKDDMMKQIEQLRKYVI